jgi:hypothetical protein
MISCSAEAASALAALAMTTTTTTTTTILAKAVPPPPGATIDASRERQGLPHGLSAVKQPGQGDPVPVLACRLTTAPGCPPSPPPAPLALSAVLPVDPSQPPPPSGMSPTLARFEQRTALFDALVDSIRADLVSIRLPSLQK